MSPKTSVSQVEVAHGALDEVPLHVNQAHGIGAAAEVALDAARDAVGGVEQRADRVVVVAAGLAGREQVDATRARDGALDGELPRGVDGQVGVQREVVAGEARARVGRVQDGVHARGGRAVVPGRAVPGRGRDGCYVLEEDGVAIAVSEERVEVSVAVDVLEAWARILANVYQTERIRHGRGERWAPGCAYIFEEVCISESLPNEGVEVAIAVEVHEVWQRVL